MNIFDQSAKVQDTVQAAQTAASNPVATALAAFSGITASAQSGDITLTGTVEDGATITAIIAAAKAGAGVTTVTSNIEVADISAKGIKLKVNTEDSNLNIRQSPSADGAIIGKAAHDEEVTLVKKTNSEWYMIKNEDGEEGYSATKYLIAV